MNQKSNINSNHVFDIPVTITEDGVTREVKAECFSELDLELRKREIERSKALKKQMATTVAEIFVSHMVVSLGGTFNAFRKKKD